MSWVHSDQRDHSHDAMRPGLFKLRLVKNGPYVPAVILRPCPIEFSLEGAWQGIDRWSPLQGWYDVDLLGRLKEECDPYKIWLGGTEIDMDDFIYYCDTRKHLQRYEPDAGDANPRAAINLDAMAPIGPRRR